MHNNLNKKHGFSLAEALITLLIVCLITLASVPVLTKKKRDLKTGVSAQWICTLNSEGKHVFWNSSTAEGDVEKPDTWPVSGGGNECSFVPPVGAKNFGVTLIGGGGGGADGVSKQELYMDSNKTTYTPPKDDKYRLAVIGSGGGGHGSDDEDGDSNRGVGGQGGGGAYYFGEVKLLKDKSYTSEIADGGPGGNDGGVKCSYGKKVNDLLTKFKVGGVDLVSAGSGQGGESTRNRGGKDPDCGGGGAGGSLFFSDLFNSTYNVKSFSQGDGRKGKDNGNIKKSGTGSSYSGWGFDNGTHFDKTYYGAQDSTSYGKGGYGNVCPKGGGNSRGSSGEKGIVRLWQVIQQRGLGGRASELESTTLANIKGKVKINVGRGGEANENGQISQATVYNLQGNIARQLKSSYGKKGELGDPVGSASYVEGEQGENSNWIAKGGGFGQRCHGTEERTEEKTNTTYIPKLDESGETICRLGFYDVGYVEALKVGDPVNAIVNCPLSNTSGIKGICLGFMDNLISDSGYMDTNKYNLYELMTYLLYSPHDSYSQAFTYTNMVAAIPVQYQIAKWKVPTVTALSAYYKGVSEDSFTCYAYESEKKETIETITYPVDAGCDEERTNAFYYGAGGGGGGTSNQVGVYGKGSAGASGAVIIEW